MGKKTDPSLSAAEQEKLLKTILQSVPFDGWDDPKLAEKAADMAGLDQTAARAAFPDVLSIFDYWGTWMDDTMRARLKKDKIDLSAMRIRDRIAVMVWTRLEILAPYKQAVAEAMKFLARPPYTLHGPKFLWNGADSIWFDAGDTATDYNHYTKRGLLSGVMAATTLYWLKDDSDDHVKSRAFLDARIEQVLHVGKAIGRAKEFLEKLPPFAAMAGKK